LPGPPAYLVRAVAVRTKQGGKGHNVNHLLTLTAVIELVAGLALVVLPSAAVTFLLGTPLDTPVALMVGRLAGAALFALGVACWLARYDGRSRAASGLVAAMLLYNLAIAAILAGARIGSGLGGVALWLAVLLHVTMAVWCVVHLRSKRLYGGNYR
jgi:hypothetical protein